MLSQPQRASTRGLRRPRATAGCLLAVLLCVSAGPRPLPRSMVAGDAPVVFSYFNPDANVRNVRLLGSRLEAYFRGRGLEVDFQVFVNYDDLARSVAKSSPGLLLLPAWGRLPDEGGTGYVPALIPTRKGSAYHDKQLVVSRKLLPEGGRLEELPPGALEGKQVATTLDRPHALEAAGRAIIDSLQISGQGVEYLRVPKDFDALMAVATSRAAAAIVLPSSLEFLQKRNAVAARRVTPLDRTCRVLNPVLHVAPGAGRDRVQPVLDALLEMVESEAGREAADLMGYDGWRRYDPQLHGTIIQGGKGETGGGKR